MQRWGALLAMAVLTACSARPPVVQPKISAADRVAAVDAEVRAGCLDCLISAYRHFDELRATPDTADAATAGAIRSAALIALRQRELGMVDEGYLDKARELAKQPNVPSWLPAILDIVDAMPRNGAGTGGPPGSDIDLQRMQRLRTNRGAWLALLRDSARYDEAAAYTLLSLGCDSIDTRNTPREELFANVEAFAGAPLVVYRESLCRQNQVATLEPLLAKDPRFVEITFSLGAELQGTRPRPKLDEAEVQYQRAYAWHPQWPRLTVTLAGVAMTAEDFERARTMYEETLKYEPHSVSALLGLVKALTYLGKYEDGIATADRLLDEHWYIGDARYWRAYDEFQLTRYDAAWDDIELAEKSSINAQIPKLAGLVAYQRHQLETAITRFKTSLERDPFDCETRFYRGVIHAEQGQWPDAVDVLTSSATCLEQREVDLKREVEQIRGSDLREDRKAKQIARREQEIAEGRRRMATSYYDCAVGYFSLKKTDEARQYAEKVADDEQFGARAKEILNRTRQP